MTDPETLVGTIGTFIILMTYLSIKKDIDTDLRAIGFVLTMLYPILILM